VIRVRPGTYAESLFGVLRPGVTVEADNQDQRPLIAPPAGSLRGVDLTGVGDVTLRSLRFDCSRVQYDCLKLTDAPRVTIDSVEAWGAPENGLLVVDWQATSAGVVVRRSSFHDHGTTDFNHGLYLSSDSALVELTDVYRNAGWGVHVYHEGGGPARCIVRDNDIHDNARIGNRGDGIILSGGPGHVAERNRVSRNKVGIWVDYGATDAIVRDNVIVDNAGVAVFVGSGATRTTVIGTRWLGNHPDAVEDRGISTVLLDNRALGSLASPARLRVGEVTHADASQQLCLDARRRRRAVDRRAVSRL
jgi:nitrous oxidase accessory protein NosD